MPWQDGVHGADLPGESPTVRTYFGYLERRPDSIVAALRTIADPPEGGAALVHCAAGKDRTGLVVALALEVAGAHREAIVADYAPTSERIAAIVGRLAASPTYARDMVTDDPHHHAARPESMARILELLDERHGSPAGWLREHGSRGRRARRAARAAHAAGRLAPQARSRAPARPAREVPSNRTRPRRRSVRRSSPARCWAAAPSRLRA